MLSHMGRRTSGVNFLYLFSIRCTVLQQNGQLSSSAMHNKGVCVLSHIDKRTSDVNFLYLFSI